MMTQEYEPNPLVHREFEWNMTGEDDYLYIRCIDHSEVIFAFTERELKEMLLNIKEVESSNSWQLVLDNGDIDKNIGKPCK
jgi:hypothetical protein